MEIYKVNVDYNKSIKEMFAACNFRDVDREVIRATPVEITQGAGQQQVELEIVDLINWGGGRASTQEILNWMHCCNLEPAKIEHLLALAASYPEQIKQNKGIIIALGTDCRFCGYPAIGCYPKGELFLSFSKPEWIGRAQSIYWSDPHQVTGFFWNHLGDCKFLAVRKR